MKLIERNQIFETHKNIASLIKGFQKVFFDEEYDTENDEMFDALKLEAEKTNEASFNLMINHRDINSYPKELFEKLKALLEYLNTDKLILISHLKIDFFGNLEHDYEKVINAYKELSKITNSKTFKETIETSVSEIENLVEIFFWLERCDASIPEYIFWHDTKERFCFYLCKYGNIHFVDFTNGKLITDDELKKIGFIVNEDYDQFSIDGRIENRQLKWSDFEDENSNLNIIQRLTAVLRNWGFKS
jgi:hypothetical protein